MIEIKGLRKSFGGLIAVEDFELVANPGEITGIIGPNGAGKSTIFNIISGNIKADDGIVLCEGINITGLKPHIIARKFRLGRTFQTAPLFPELTAFQSMIIAAQINAGRKYGKCVFYKSFFTKHELNAAEKALEFVGLTSFENFKTMDLPHGDLQRLRLGMVLATKPKILLLDEPFSGMNAEEIEKMGRLIIELKSQNKTILMVEHNMMAVMSLCNKITCISFGKIICEGLPEDVKENKGVIECYLGAENVAESE